MEFFVGLNDGPQLLRKFPGTPRGYVDAVDFIDTLEGAQDGLYYLDGPELDEAFLDSVELIRYTQTGVAS